MAAGLARARLVHPEWWVYVLAAAAWLGLSFTHVPPRAPAHHHHEGVSAGAATHRSAGFFLLMVAAMMLPFVGPAVRHIAETSFWKRRQRAAASYVLGFSAVWAAFALGLFAAQAALPLRGSGEGLASAAAVAGVWQASGLRRRAAIRCGSRPALPQRGWYATRRTFEAGGAFGLRCVPLCGPAMAIMAFSPRLLTMVAVFVVQTYEWRRGPNPFSERRWYRPAAAYGAIATLAAFGVLSD